MYQNKPSSDHNLLQAIARTNRVYKNKEAGKIIDYYGITRNLYDALDFDEEIVDSAMIDIERVKERFSDVLSDIMKLFIGVNIEDPGSKICGAVSRFLLMIKTSKNISQRGMQSSRVCSNFFLRIHF